MGEIRPIVSRKPLYFYKLRKISSRNEEDYYGITVPAEIAKSFKDAYFFLEVKDNTLIFTSGAKKKT